MYLYFKPNPTMKNILYMYNNSMHNPGIVTCTQYLDKQSLTRSREITITYCVPSVNM